MERNYRIIFESYDKKKPTKTISRTTLLDDSIEKPTSLLNLSMGIDGTVKLTQQVHSRSVLREFKRKEAVGQPQSR
jgi:hypothetical protein